jgi:hypothetical protein
MGLEGQKAFPFIYSFINRNDDQWAAQSVMTTQAAALTNIVNGIGPLVPANSKITHNVMLDPDYIFKLLSIKYTAYYSYEVPPNGVGEHFGAYQWYENTLSSQIDAIDPDMQKVGTPLSHYIGITLSFMGSGAQVLYGGDDQGPVPTLRNGSRRVPLPVEVIQGYDYGYLTMRIPHLLPQQACLVFEISNFHPTYDLVVGAGIYGMKIRM